jgi:ABC-type nitrate/sulfonate/bicarbonate transport system substrate-binding protein
MNGICQAKIGSGLRSLAVALCVAVLAWAGTCGSASALDLVIGEGLGIQWAPFYLADKNGAWKRQGLTVKSSIFASGRLVLDALLGGGLAVGTSSETPIVFATLNGLPVRIIAALNRYEPFDLVALKAINGGKDLKGHKIGVTKGSNAHYFLSKLLEASGLSDGDVIEINLNPSDLVGALANSSIDAFVWTEPQVSLAVNAAPEKFHVIRFPGLYSGYSAVITLQGTIDRDPGSLVKMLAALNEIDKDLKADPTDLVTIGAERTNLDIAFVRDYLPRLQFGLALPKDELVKELKSQAAWAMKEKLVRPDAVMPNFDEVVVTKLLTAAQSK